LVKTVFLSYKMMVDIDCYCYLCHMRENLLAILLVFSVGLLAQTRDSAVMYYPEGMLASKFVLDDSNQVMDLYTYYSTGEVFVHALHDRRGVLKGFYRFNEAGDTIEKSLHFELAKIPKAAIPKTGWETIAKGVEIFYIDNANVGVQPYKGSVLQIEYKGYFEDGSSFDNSYLTKAPMVFKLGDNILIPGLERILPLLYTNRRCMVRLAPEMAYGSNVVANIPPNTTLIYELELVNFE
jgi:FKBP-type peptidyl-prolyl cis-trans isomerase